MWWEHKQRGQPGQEYVNSTCMQLHCPYSKSAVSRMQNLDTSVHFTVQSLWVLQARKRVLRRLYIMDSFPSKGVYDLRPIGGRHQRR